MRSLVAILLSLCLCTTLHGADVVMNDAWVADRCAAIGAMLVGERDRSALERRLAKARGAERDRLLLVLARYQRVLAGDHARALRRCADGLMSDPGWGEAVDILLARRARSRSDADREAVDEALSVHVGAFPPI